jgi:hypothetical protein
MYGLKSDSSIVVYSFRAIRPESIEGSMRITGRHCEPVRFRTVSFKGNPSRTVETGHKTPKELHNELRHNQSVFR